MSKRKCPTPAKRAYDDQDAAQHHVNGLYAREGKAAMVRAYKCRCGSWHVGGMRKKHGRKRRQW